MKKIVAFIIVMVCFLQSSLTSFAFTDTQNNPFTSKKYTHDDKFIGYQISYGVDVSEWQSSADFAKVKAAGADYVILRAACRGYASKGTLFKDKKFDQYIVAAQNAGLDVGAYIFSQAITVKEAQEEADYILNIVKNYKITLPIVFDYEYTGPSTARLRAANLTNKQRTNICLAFCKRVEDAGYTAMVYANQSMLTGDLVDETIAKEYDIWLANYSTSPKYNGKLYDCDYTYWQYSSTGKVNGLPGNIDCNFRYFKAPQTVTGLKIIDESITETKIGWNKVKGCYGYEIFRLNTTTNQYDYIGLSKGAGKTSFSDNTINGMPATYKVRAISAYKGSMTGGGFSEPLTTTGCFIINVDSYSTGKCTISWPAYENATEYEVYRCASENGTYSLIGKTDANTRTFTDTTKSGFKTYYYKIRAVVRDSNGLTTDLRYTPVKAVKKQQPKIKSVALSSNTKIKITWSNVAGASGTKIYRKAANGKYKRIKTINNNTTTSFVDKSVKKGTKYSYQIRQFVTVGGVNYYSDYTSVKSATPMKTVSITVTPSKKKVKISYKKVAGASGYEIYMKQSGGTYKLIKSTSKSSYTKTKLSAGKKYSFKVRAYKKVNGKRVYASFSKVKTVRPKY